ncbi:Cytochrome b5 domain-containing protein RLF [Arachis hypogaea]|nr:Cytochrome b5 domain-containing protein RLF [Arachis hypogaea]
MMAFTRFLQKLFLCVIISIVISLCLHLYDLSLHNISSQEGIETTKLASDIADISIKEKSSSSPTTSSNQDGGFLWKDGFTNNSNSIKEDNVSSLSFTVTSATSCQPNELNKKLVMSDGMNSIQRSSELKSLVAKPAAQINVPFEKGYSQMDWLKLTRTHPDLASSLT